MWLLYLSSMTLGMVMKPFNGNGNGTGNGNEVVYYDAETGQ